MIRGGQTRFSPIKWIVEWDKNPRFTSAWTIKTETDTGPSWNWITIATSLATDSFLLGDRHDMGVIAGYRTSTENKREAKALGPLALRAEMRAVLFVPPFSVKL